MTADVRTEGLQDLRILVVEDDYMIAKDLTRSLANRGAEVVGPARSVADAMARIEAEPALDSAVLDINLGPEMVYPVADALAARGVPFVFATGYSAIVVPTAYADVPRVEKPVDVGALARVLARTIKAASRCAS